MVNGEVRVREGLRLDSLGGVDDQERAFAGGERARNLVGKIHVARCVDEVELIDLPVLCGVHHADGMGLDGNAAFALEVHGIKDLLLHLAHCQGAGQFQQAIGQRRFSVVDVRDDREVADVSGVHFIGSIFDSNRGIEGAS